jgi:solute carrier family 3 protein 2
MNENSEKISHKLDIKKNSQDQESGEKIVETYKKISEEIPLADKEGEKTVGTEMVRENGESPHDEAAEKMLSTENEKEKLAEKSVEVKFIVAENQNGDAKIDIGNIEKTFTGMTKEELMKYANDPFWVRLRWFLFVLFWAAWIAMLVGAILIIVYAPRCEKPSPLIWWKKGPLVTLKSGEENPDADTLKKFGAKGVVFELPDTDTYFVDTEAVEKKIKDVVEKYQPHNIEVIVDLTPNYVTKDDKLFQESLVDESKRAAFVVLKNTPPSWLSVVEKGKSAWKNLNNSAHYLNQFGEDRYDLQLGNEMAQEKLLNVLKHLIGLGVKGIRLSNAKHFVIKTGQLSDDTPISQKGDRDLTDYNFYSHRDSTYQEELGDVLQKFARAVHNYSNGDGFLTIKDDMIHRPESYYVKDSVRYGFDLPHFSQLAGRINSNKNVNTVLKNYFETVFNKERSNIWPQWAYTSGDHVTLPKKSYNMFMMLLPGVPIVDFDLLHNTENKTDINQLIEARNSEVFMHGNVEFFTSKNDTAFGYTRVRSGNPGYFVAINPTNLDVFADFSHLKHVSSELTANMLGDDYDQNNKKFSLNNISMKRNSAIWLTFVPQSH